MSDLVRRLSEGKHPVEISLRPERTNEALRECLDRGYVHVRFTATRGGTELGVPIDRDRTDLSQANLDAGSGRLTIAGNLKLDFVRVRCVANVELPAMVGTGYLEILEQSTDAAS